LSALDGIDARYGSFEEYPAENASPFDGDVERLRDGYRKP